MHGKMDYKRALGLSVFAFALLVQPGCGGGGGNAPTAGGLPVAPDPSCSSIIPRITPLTAQQIQSTLKEQVIVPSTSLERFSDIGLRAHTNHLILIKTSRGIGPTGFSPSQIRTAYGVPTGGAGA